MLKRKRSKEFSKQLLYVIFTVTGILIIFTMFMVYRTNDTTALSYLIPSIFVEVATATSFYYWKAKAENQIKLKQQYGYEEQEEN